MKLLLYCTKAKPYLYKEKCDWTNINEYLNGKIVAECNFEVKYEDTAYKCLDFRENGGLEKSCLNKEQLFDYVKGKSGFYAIHIKNLKERVMELSDCHSKKTFYKYGCYCTEYNPVIKAPQNMMKVIDEYGNKYILISIRPEWLVKILNGEKTIEVRRKVLKVMLEDDM